MGMGRPAAIPVESGLAHPVGFRLDSATGYMLPEPTNLEEGECSGRMATGRRCSIPEVLVGMDRPDTSSAGVGGSHYVPVGYRLDLAMGYFHPESTNTAEALGLGQMASGRPVAIPEVLVGMGRPAASPVGVGGCRHLGLIATERKV